MKMEFRQLEYFFALSRFKNFTRAAQSLNVSQPSVTKAIKVLEKELKLTLIDRSQKQVHLTEEGKAFLLHTEKILHAVEEAQQDMKRFRNDADFILHFGIPPLVEAYLFPDFFTKCTEHNPHLTLDLHEYNDSVEVRRRTEVGELDFGIIFADPEVQGENEMLILKDSMNLCVYKEHPLANEEHVSIASLKNEKFIMQQPHSYQYRSFYRLCEENGFTPDIVLSASQLKTIKQLVANKMGISVLPDFVTRNESTLKKCSFRPPFLFHVCLIWRSDKCLSDIDRRFISFMRAYISSKEFKENYLQR